MSPGLSILAGSSDVSQAALCQRACLGWGCEEAGRREIIKVEAYGQVIHRWGSLEETSEGAV